MSPMKDDRLRGLIDKTETPRTVVAREIGISRQYLYELQDGKQAPTAPVIVRLLAFFNRPENLKKMGRTRKPVTFEELFSEAA